MTERRLPPITQIAMFSFVLVIASGIWIVSHLPKHVPLGLPVALLALSVLLMIGNLLLIRSIPDFNWASFFGVAKWALVAYLIITGLLEWVFVKDGTRGSELLVLTLSLAIFAVHVPVLMGYTVARYAD
jgi:hypothetical protein